MTALNPDEREELARVWAAVVMRSLEDEEFGRRLRDDPATVLNESGLPIQAGARIELIRPRVDAGPDLGGQIDMYEEGRRSGSYRFFLPELGDLETREITEEDLEAIAAGACCGGDIVCCSCTR